MNVYKGYSLRSVCFVSNNTLPAPAGPRSSVKTPKRASENEEVLVGQTVKAMVSRLVSAYRDKIPREGNVLGTTSQKSFSFSNHNVRERTRVLLSSETLIATSPECFEQGHVAGSNYIGIQRGPTVR